MTPPTGAGPSGLPLEVLLSPPSAHKPATLSDSLCENHLQLCLDATQAEIYASRSCGATERNDEHFRNHLEGTGMAFCTPAALFVV